MAKTVIFGSREDDVLRILHDYLDWVQHESMDPPFTILWIDGSGGVVVVGNVPQEINLHTLPLEGWLKKVEWIPFFVKPSDQAPPDTDVRIGEVLRDEVNWRPGDREIFFFPVPVDGKNPATDAVMEKLHRIMEKRGVPASIALVH